MTIEDGDDFKVAAKFVADVNRRYPLANETWSNLLNKSIQEVNLIEIAEAELKAKPQPGCKPNLKKGKR